MRRLSGQGLGCLGCEDAAKFSKEFIVSELHRLAAANGGKAPGRKAFFDDTGISENQINKYWTGYSSLVKEAGFEAKQFSIQKLPDENVLAGLAEIALKVGRMPTIAEMRKARQEGTLAFSPDVVERFGAKADQEAALKAFCKDKTEYSALVARLNSAVLEDKVEEAGVLDAADMSGFVYLMRSGKHYKIGKTNHVGRRHYDLAIQLPEKLQVVHEISTDDPVGIEGYWHRRFADKRLNGEWFNLPVADVAAFKRRKFM
jgi:hypothetical protein